MIFVCIHEGLTSLHRLISLWHHSCIEGGLVDCYYCAIYRGVAVSVVALCTEYLTCKSHTFLSQVGPFLALQQLYYESAYLVAL